MKYGLAVILTLGVITTSWASDEGQLPDTDAERKDTTSHQVVVKDPQLARIDTEIDFYDKQIKAVPTEGNPVINQILRGRMEKGKDAFSKLRNDYLKDPQMNVSAAIIDLCNSPAYLASH